MRVWQLGTMGVGKGGRRSALSNGAAPRSGAGFVHILVFLDSSIFYFKLFVPHVEKENGLIFSSELISRFSSTGKKRGGVVFQNKQWK